MLVTVNTFTRGAGRKAAARVPETIGCEICLMESHDLLRLLEVDRDKPFLLDEFDKLRIKHRERIKSPISFEPSYKKVGLA